MSSVQKLYRILSSKTILTAAILPIQDREGIPQLHVPQHMCEKVCIVCLKSVVIEEASLIPKYGKELVSQMKLYWPFQTLQSVLM